LEERIDLRGAHEFNDPTIHLDVGRLKGSRQEYAIEGSDSRKRDVRLSVGEGTPAKVQDSRVECLAL
jgi:hypothetical protein